MTAPWVASSAGVAGGELTEPPLPSAQQGPPYMLKINSLPDAFIGPYVPMWKVLKDKDRISNLLRYLEDKKSVITKWNTNKDTDATHVTMNGGKFVIRPDDEDDFLKYYAVALTAGYQMWFVEQLTDVFRYFADLDVEQANGLSEATIEHAAKAVQLAVRKFYPDVAGEPDGGAAALRLVVCTTNYKYKEAADGSRKVKTGIHLLWPGLCVDRETALHMRESIMVQLQILFGKRVAPNNSWSDVVDASVYGKGGEAARKGSGLRMLGSRKTDPCPECKCKRKDKEGVVCGKCAGNGRVDTGRPYFPLVVLDADGARDLAAEQAYRCNMQLLVADTKVRTQHRSRAEFEAAFPSRRWALPDGAPKFIDERKSQAARRVSKGAATEAEGGAKPRQAKAHGGAQLRLSNGSRASSAPPRARDTPASSSRPSRPTPSAPSTACTSTARTAASARTWDASTAATASGSP